MQIRTRPRETFDYADNRLIDIECFPQQAVPVAVDMIMRRALPSSWSDEERRDGEDMIARSIMSIYAGCLNPTSKAVDRVYRLINTLYTGQMYTATVDANGQAVISPAIPDAPTPMPTMPLAYGIEALDKRMDNAFNGTLFNGYPAGPGQRALLEAILQAIQAQGNSGAEDIIPILQAILAALA